MAQPIRQDRRVAAVTIHSAAGFTEIRSSLDALMRNTGQDFHIRQTEHPSFLSGRCGEIRSNDKDVGMIGELNPMVLRTLGLNLPAAAFELELSSDVGRTGTIRSMEA
jgi:phenylalanyl-tRNA synthetase beta chain